MKRQPVMSCGLLRVATAASVWAAPSRIAMEVLWVVFAVVSEQSGFLTSAPVYAWVAMR